MSTAMEHVASAADVSGTSLRRRVQRTLLRSRVPMAGRRALALCSGGVDSVCLVDLLATMPRGSRPRELVVLFLDHGLRDTAAERAAARAVAARHRLRFEERAAAAGEILADNLQDRARSWRYATAATVAKVAQCDVVVTGHHADDQLETLLLGLVCGGGLRALAGIPVERELAHDLQLVRPLLDLSRAELAEHARRRGLEWADDPSNATTDYRRNAIRHTVVPALAATHPGAAANAERVRRHAAALTGARDELAEMAVSLLKTADRSLDVRRLERLSAHARASVLAAWLREAGLGRTLSERVLRAVDRLVVDGQSGESVAIRDACVVRDGYVLRVSEPTPPR